MPSPDNYLPARLGLGLTFPNAGKFKLNYDSSSPDTSVIHISLQALVTVPTRSHHACGASSHWASRTLLASSPCVPSPGPGSSIGSKRSPHTRHPHLAVSDTPSPAPHHSLSASA